jgi:hypothetical protein
MATIDDLLLARNARKGHKTGDKAGAHSRIQLTRYIAQNCKLYDTLRAHLFHPDHHPVLADTHPAIEVARHLERLGWVKNAAPHTWLLACDEKSRLYLAGGWLEEYSFLAHEAVGVDEIYFGQEIVWSVNGIDGKNEIDVIARRGDLLSFTSCKAIRPDKSTSHTSELRDFLTETSYWNSHFANGSGRTLLITTADMVDEEQGLKQRYPQLLARASILHVDVSGYEELEWNRLLETIENHWD